MKGLIEAFQVFVAPKIESLNTAIEFIKEDFKNLTNDAKDLKKEINAIESRVSKLEGKYKNITTNVFLEIENKILKSKLLIEK